MVNKKTEQIAMPYSETIEIFVNMAGNLEPNKCQLATRYEDRGYYWDVLQRNKKQKFWLKVNYLCLVMMCSLII